jgi:PTS system beta-glucosides-specific IIC component
MIGVRETLSVYFINAPVADYSQAFLPIILACPILKYVMRFLEKYTPKMFSIILVPTLTILVMVFVLFVICGPVGNYLGLVIGSIFTGLAEANVFIRIIGAIALCVAWPYLILFGMHMPVIQLALFSLMGIGYDPVIWPTAIAYNFAMMGCGLGAFLKIKDKEEKGIALSAFITSFIGGITEPTMYGILMRYKKGFRSIMIACATGGLLIGILGTKVFNLAGLMNIITLPIIFAGGSTSNHLLGTIVLVVSLLVGVISSYFLVDYTKKA